MQLMPHPGKIEGFVDYLTKEKERKTALPFQQHIDNTAQTKQSTQGNEAMKS